jgi:hypothetical protein
MIHQQVEADVKRIARGGYRALGVAFKESDEGLKIIKATAS